MTTGAFEGSGVALTVGLGVAAVPVGSAVTVTGAAVGFKVGALVGEGVGPGTPKGQSSILGGAKSTCNFG